MREPCPFVPQVEVGRKVVGDTGAGKWGGPATSMDRHLAATRWLAGICLTDAGTTHRSNCDDARHSVPSEFAPLTFWSPKGAIRS